MPGVVAAIKQVLGQFTVGKGVTNSAAQMQINSTTKGFLPPRMTTAQRNAITTPPEGLEVIDTDLHCCMVYLNSAWTIMNAPTVIDGGHA